MDRRRDLDVRSFPRAFDSDLFPGDSSKVSRLDRPESYPSTIVMLMERRLRRGRVPIVSTSAPQPPTGAASNATAPGNDSKFFSQRKEGIFHDSVTRKASSPRRPSSMATMLSSMGVFLALLPREDAPRSEDVDVSFGTFPRTASPRDSESFSSRASLASFSSFLAASRRRRDGGSWKLRRRRDFSAVVLPLGLSLGGALPRSR